MSEFDILDKAAADAGFWVQVQAPWKSGEQYQVTLTRQGYGVLERSGPRFSGASVQAAARRAIEWLEAS